MSLFHPRCIYYDFIWGFVFYFKTLFFNITNHFRVKLSNKNQHTPNQPEVKYFVIYLHPSKLNKHYAVFKECLIS